MSSSIRLYFNTSGDRFWNRQEWFGMLDRLAPHAQRATVVDREYDADLVVVTRAPWKGWASLCPVAGRGILARKGEGPPAVAWDTCDYAVGVLPGLYASLPRAFFDPRRHRACSYPLTYNDRIHSFDLSDAEVLVTFHGSMTHPVRRAVVAGLAHHDRCAVEIQENAWGDVLKPDGENMRRAYAESLRRSKFFLCPRGKGTGSIRLFETMRAGRVPVVLSDDYVFHGEGLEDGPDWESFCLVVPEAEAATVHAMCERAEDRWKEMATRAREAWELYYSDEVLLDQVANDLSDVARQETGVVGAARIVAAIGRNAVTRTVGRLR